jgi:hypothetical protein
MAVTADVDIANLALARLGQDAITTLTAGTRDSTIINRVYTQNRDYCLGLYNWVSVTRREPLVRAGKIAITGISAAAPPVVTCTGHLYVNGDLITIEDVSGMTEVNGGVFIVQSRTTTSISLYTTDLVAASGTLWTAYTSGGYVYHHATNDWAYVYDLPSLCLRVLEVVDEYWGRNTSYEWHREKNRIYCNLEYPAVRYLMRETDVTAYDSQLVEFLAARLAWLVAAKVTSDETVIRNAQVDWVTVSQQARIQNAKNSKSAKAPEALWTSRG